MSARARRTRRRVNPDELIGPVVAIVGRPNVGKSTLFNRLIGVPLAVVGDEEGITRDRNYAGARWNDVPFVVVDTGGYAARAEDAMLTRVKSQVRLALEEANLVLFVVEAGLGPVEDDLAIARILQQSERRVMVIANKADRPDREEELYEFLSLGLQDAIPVSGLHGRGTGDLLDKIVETLVSSGLVRTEEGNSDDRAEGEPVEAGEDLAKQGGELRPPQEIRIAVVGRPNVGKSSLVNALVGEERVLVDPIAGTTRDAVDTRLEHEGRVYILVDTAGIRRMAKRDPGVEQWSALRSERALARAEVALLLFDAGEGPTRQEARIAALADELGKGLVLVVNKWDLVARDERDVVAYQRELAGKFPFVRYAHILFTSALTREGVRRVLPMASEVAAERRRVVPREAVESIVDEALRRRQPVQRGRWGRVYGARQVGVAPPVFALTVNDPELFSDNYLRYLSNRIRGEFPFRGTPIRFTLQRRARRGARREENSLGVTPRARARLGPQRQNE